MRITAPISNVPAPRLTSHKEAFEFLFQGLL